MWLPAMGASLSSQQIDPKIDDKVAAMEISSGGSMLVRREGLPDGVSHAAVSSPLEAPETEEAYLTGLLGQIEKPDDDPLEAEEKAVQNDQNDPDDDDDSDKTIVYNSSDPLMSQLNRAMGVNPSNNSARDTSGFTDDQDDRGLDGFERDLVDGFDYLPPEDRDPADDNRRDNADSIVRALDRAYALGRTPVPSSDDEDSDAGKIVAICIIVAVMIVAGIAVYLFLMRNYMPWKPTHEEATGESPSSEATGLLDGTQTIETAQDEVTTENPESASLAVQ